MRIAVVHSFYNSRIPSGENVVVAAQIGALKSAGHEVDLVAQYSDERLRRRTYPAEAAATIMTGFGPDPTVTLESFAPDVVHVHNLFPNFGTRWLERWRGSLVATLHNFRPMCAAGSLSRDGETCTRCPDGDRWASLRYGCYRDSRLASVPLAWRNRGGVTRDPVITRADALIVISQRARSVYTNAGVPDERLNVLPNFVSTPPPATDAHRMSNGRWLFVGRVSPEKGLVELLRSWPEDELLDVIGDGVDMTQAVAVAPAGVTFYGTMGHEEVRRRMPAYLGMVFPSIWFEAGPTQVYVEALVAGLPVLAIEGNGTSDDIRGHDLGVVLGRRFDRNQVLGGLDYIRRHRAELSAKCMRSHAERFSEAQWVRGIEKVYQHAVHGVGK